MSFREAWANLSNFVSRAAGPLAPGAGTRGTLSTPGGLAPAEALRAAWLAVGGARVSREFSEAPLPLLWPGSHGQVPAS